MKTNIQVLVNKSRINTISGFIDYSISPKSNADFDLDSFTGEMFTNLDF